MRTTDFVITLLIRNFFFKATCAITQNFLSKVRIIRYMSLLLENVSKMAYNSSIFNIIYIKFTFA